MEQGSSVWRLRDFYEEGKMNKEKTEKTGKNIYYPALAQKRGRERKCIRRNSCSIFPSLMLY